MQHHISSHRTANIQRKTKQTESLQLEKDAAEGRYNRPKKTPGGWEMIICFSPQTKTRRPSMNWLDRTRFKPNKSLQAIGQFAATRMLW